MSPGGVGKICVLVHHTCYLLYVFIVNKYKLGFIISQHSDQMYLLLTLHLVLIIMSDTADMEVKFLKNWGTLT